VEGFDRFHSYTTSGKAWWKGLSAQWFGTYRGLGIPTGAFGSVFNRTDNRYRDGRALAELRYEPALSGPFEVSARAYANYGYFGLHFLYPAEEETPTGPVAWEQADRETYKGAWVGAELRGVYAPSPRLRLTLGTEATRHFEVQIHTEFDDFDGTVEPLLDLDAPYTVLAGYALAEWRPGPRWILSGGLRVDRWDTSQDAVSLDTGNAVAEDFTSANPRVAAIYKPSAHDELKLMGGRAFRAPSAYEYFYTDNGASQVTSDCCGTHLRPETVYSAEVEYTHRFDDDWSVLGATHALIADDLVETVEVPAELAAESGWPDGTVYYRNSPVAQRNLGVDLEVRREFRAGSMLSASYGFLDARYADPPEEGGSTRVTNAPRHFFSFRGVVPIVPGLVTGALRSTLEAPRRIDAGGDATSRPAMITDVVLSGQVNRWDVRYALGLYNLFNWQYALPTGSFASPLMPQQGRSLLVSVTVAR
jgi:outer membrane receptor for ferrienterochelin and colicins